MIDGLRKLIEAVEAGEVRPYVIEEMAAPLFHHSIWPNIAKSYDGSLDAAIALCEVLLPGWVATIGTVGYAIVCENETKITRHASALLSRQPARALLLAVLRAKLMEMEMENE